MYAKMYSLCNIICIIRYTQLLTHFYKYHSYNVYIRRVLPIIIILVSDDKKFMTPQDEKAIIIKIKNINRKFGRELVHANFFYTKLMRTSQ